MCLEYLQTSFRTFIKNYRQLLAGSLTIMLFTAAFFSLSFTLIFKDPLPLMTSAYLDGSYFAVNDIPMLIAGVLVLIASVLALIVLQGGFYAMALESLSKKAELRTMVKIAKTKWKTIIGAFAVLGLIYLFMFTVSFIMLGYLYFNPIATAAIAITIFAVSIFFSFVYPAIARGSGYIESLKSSFSAARKNYVEAMLLVLFFSLASFLLRSAIELLPTGDIFSYVLIYVLIVPWEALAFSLFFQRMSHKKR